MNSPIFFAACLQVSGFLKIFLLVETAKNSLRIYGDMQRNLPDAVRPAIALVHLRCFALS